MKSLIGRALELSTALTPGAGHLDSKVLGAEDGGVSAQVSPPLKDAQSTQAGSLAGLRDWARPEKSLRW